MLLKANPGLRCRNVGQLGFCGRGVFVFGSAFVLCIKVIGSPSAASANPIKHLPASFPSRLQLEKFSAQMHLSHRRSHLCPKRLIALDANCNFGQRRLGPAKTIQSSPELAIMPGRFLLMCVFDICLISQQIGKLAELSNRKCSLFQPIRQDSSSAGTVTGLTGWPAYLFLHINFKAMAFHLFCNILQPFCVFPTGLILSFTSRRVKNRICVSLMLLAAILPSLNPRRLITSVSRGGVGEKWRQRKVVKSCQNSSASPPSPCSGKLGSTCFVSQSAQVRPASTIYLSAIPDLIILCFFCI